MSTTLNRRTTTVILFQGDDLDPIADRLVAVQRAAATSSPRRLSEEDPTSVSVHDYDAFMDKAVERAVKINLVALPRKAYRDLLAEHPVRLVPGEDGKQVPHEDDAPYGFNSETFGDSLVPACIADGQFDSDAERDAFVDDLSDGDFSKLYSAAIDLNRSLGPNPKARLSSHLEPTSEETSASPERLG